MIITYHIVPLHAEQKEQKEALIGELRTKLKTAEEHLNLHATNRGKHSYLESNSNDL